MDVSLIIPAFIAGVLTFLAPCTLPLVPGYLGFISGASFEDLKDPDKHARIKKVVLKNGILYVLGFSIVFILMGTVFGAAGLSLGNYRPLLSRVGGVFVIIFGLYMMHILRMPAFNFLNKEHKLNIVSKLQPGKPSSSFLFGATFAFGWTPCVGPVLGAVLTLALTTQTLLEAALLLTVFSIGLAIPFIIIAALFGSATVYIKKITKYLNIVSFVGGIFLLFIGILLVTDSLVLWNAYAYKFFDFAGYRKILDYL